MLYFRGNFSRNNVPLIATLDKRNVLQREVNKDSIDDLGILKDYFDPFAIAIDDWEAVKNLTGQELARSLGMKDTGRKSTQFKATKVKSERKQAALDFEFMKDKMKKVKLWAQSEKIFQQLYLPLRFCSLN